MLLTHFAFFIAILVHPLHVCVTEIKLDSKDKELEITSRFFIDDLEEAIRKETNRPSLDILNPGGGETTDQLVSKYVQTKLWIKADAKKVKINYLGHEIEDDAIILYMYAPGIKKLKTIEVYYAAITEVYDDQSNLVHVTVGEKTRSMRLMRNFISNTIIFEK